MTQFKTLFMLLLFCSSTAMARPTLELQLKKSTAELGRPVYLKIIGDELKTDLSTLSLHSLNEQFVLDTRDLDSEIFEHDKTNDPTRRQTLSLKLFPRHTGELLIPAFSIDNVSSNEKTLIINEASTNGENISLDWELTSSEAWQREQIVVSLTLSTPEQYATIKLAKQSVDGFELTALPVQREWIEEKQRGRSRITAGWSLLALKPGIMKIDLPAIEYHLGGVIRRTFYLPEIKLAIRPLPSYLPPTIPVGKVNIESSITPTGMLNTNNLAYWNVSIESKSLTPYWLPPILRQINSADEIHFFPATSKRSMHPDSEGVHGRVNHTIPFKPLNDRRLDLPLLKIQYFDPASGRLETVEHKAARPISTGFSTRILAILALFAVALYLLRMFYRYSRTQIKYRRQNLHALKLIKEATTNGDVLAGLRRIGEAEGWPVNLTLSEWLQRWQMRYRTEMQMKDCIQTLSDSCYGRGNEIKLKEIKSNLADLLKEPKKAR